PSGNKTTTSAAGPARSATLTAATTAIPHEPPTNKASSRASRRVISNESASDTAMISSGTVGSYADGQKSSPTPSTRYGRPVPPEYTDPSGSTPTMRTFPPDTSLRERPAPVMVPPVPTPATKWVTLPSVSAHT